MSGLVQELLSNCLTHHDLSAKKIYFKNNAKQDSNWQCVSMWRAGNNNNVSYKATHSIKQQATFHVEIL